MLEAVRIVSIARIARRVRSRESIWEARRSSADTWSHDDLEEMEEQ